jgi:hypothetical protein
MTTGSEAQLPPPPPPTDRRTTGINLLLQAQAELTQSFDKGPSATAMALGALLISVLIVAQVFVELNVISPPGRYARLTSFEFGVGLGVGAALVVLGAGMRMYTYRRAIDFDILRFEKGAALLEATAEAGKAMMEKGDSKPPAM